MKHEELYDEILIPLQNGGTLRCGKMYDRFGDYVRICDANGNEILYWDSAEWQEDEVLVMGAIFGAATKSIQELTKDRKLVDGVWVYEKR